MKNLCTQLFTLEGTIVQNWKPPKCQNDRGDREVNHDMSMLWRTYSHFIPKAVFIGLGK